MYRFHKVESLLSKVYRFNYPERGITNEGMYVHTILVQYTNSMGSSINNKEEYRYNIYINYLESLIIRQDGLSPIAPAIINTKFYLINL